MLLRPPCWIRKLGRMPHPARVHPCFPTLPSNSPAQTPLAVAAHCCQMPVPCTARPLWGPPRGLPTLRPAKGEGWPRRTSGRRCHALNVIVRDPRTTGALRSLPTACRFASPRSPSGGLRLCSSPQRAPSQQASCRSPSPAPRMSMESYPHRATCLPTLPDCLLTLSVSCERRALRPAA